MLILGVTTTALFPAPPAPSPVVGAAGGDGQVGAVCGAGVGVRGAVVLRGLALRQLRGGLCHVVVS